MSGKISSDKLQWELLIKDSEAQREITKLTQKNKELEKSNKEVRLEMAKLEAQGKKNSAEWNGLRDVLQKNSTEISNNTKLIKANEDQLGTQNMTMQQLKKRYAELQKELNNTSKALDPKAWEATKAKMDETKNAMDEMSGKTKKSEGVLLSWSSAMKVGVMGALAGIGMKIVSVVTDWFSLDKILSSTQKTGDLLEATMAGLNGSLDYVRKSLATMDFSNFLENIQNAYEVAYKVKEQLDELFELNNSFQITDIGVKAQIEDLYEEMQNVNLSDEKRIQAAKEIERLTNEQARKLKSIHELEANAYETLLMDQTKLNQSQLQFIVDKYIENRESIDKAKELIKLEDDLNKQRKAGGSQSAGSDARALSTKDYDAAKKKLDNFRKVNQFYLSSIEETAKVVRGYDRSNDEFVTKYVESRVKMLSVDVEAQNSLRRVVKAQNTLLKSIADDAVKRQEDISKQTKEQQEKGYEDEIKAAEEAAGKKSIALKKLFKDGIISQSEFAARSGEIEDELIIKKIQVNTIYSKSITELEDTLLSKQLERLEKQKVEFTKLWDDIESKTKKTTADLGKKDTDEIARSIEEVTKLFDDAAEAANKVLSTREIKLDALQTGLDAEVAALQNSLDFQMITQEQFEEGVTNLKKEHWKERFKLNSKGAEDILQVVQNALSIAAKMSEDLQNMEMAQLEAKKQKELTLYGTTAEKRSEIEKKYEEEKLKIQKKYADLDMGIKIAQTLAAGALAIIQAFSQLGPVAGAIAAVVVGATTAIQVATIVAQRNAIKNSSVSGSSSSFGGARTLVGANSSTPQYSAPSISVPSARQPAAPSTVNNIQRLTSERSAGSIDNSATISANTEAMNSVAKYLKKLDENPIVAYTVLDEHNAKNELRTRIKKVGSL